MKAVLFVLMMAGTPVEHFDSAYECNQAAVELLNETGSNLIGCESYDEEGKLIVSSSRDVRYIYGVMPDTTPRLVIEVK